MTALTDLLATLVSLLADEASPSDIELALAGADGVASHELAEGPPGTTGPGAVYLRLGAPVDLADLEGGLGSAEPLRPGPMGPPAHRFRFGREAGAWTASVIARSEPDAPDRVVELVVQRE